MLPFWSLDVRSSPVARLTLSSQCVRAATLAAFSCWIRLNLPESNRTLRFASNWSTRWRICITSRLVSARRSSITSCKLWRCGVSGRLCSDMSAGRDQPSRYQHISRRFEQVPRRHIGCAVLECWVRAYLRVYGTVTAASQPLATSPACSIQRHPYASAAAPGSAHARAGPPEAPRCVLLLRSVGRTHARQRKCVTCPGSCGAVGNSGRELDIPPCVLQWIEEFKTIYQWKSSAPQSCACAWVGEDPAAVPESPTATTW